MTSGGSKQLQAYRRAREFGHPRSIAACATGIGLEEARLIDADDERQGKGRAK